MYSSMPPSPQQAISLIIERIKEHFYKTFDTKKLDTYIEPMGAEHSKGINAQPMGQCLEAFLNNKLNKTLLIQGAAGIGKSLFSQYAAHHLWTQRTTTLTDCPNKLYLPLWLWLPTLLKKAEGKDLIHCFLASQGLFDKEINAIQQACQCGELHLLLILDGWDEVPVLQTNLLNENQWFQSPWPHMKLIVTSRPEILTQYRGGYRRFFCGDQEVSSQLQEIYLQPFTQEHVTLYVQAFIRQCINDEQYKPAATPLCLLENATSATATSCDQEGSFLFWPDDKLYLQAINTLPGLQSLSQTPFILTLLIQVLPRILLEEDQTTEDIQQKAITHHKLYTYFVDHWLTQQVNRLWKNKTTHKFLLRYLEVPQTTANIDNLEDRLKQRLKACMCTYSENLARTAFNQQQGTLNVLLDSETTLNQHLLHTPHDPIPYFKKSLDEDTMKQCLQYVRSGSLLRCQLTTTAEKEFYSFLHKSLLEYFAAKRLERGVCTAIDWYTQSQPDDITREEFSLNDQLLNQEPNVIRFLADKAQSDSIFKQLLYQIIEFSKQTPVVATASANAFTILNAGGEIFNGFDFSKARFPGANLTNIIAQGAQFANADCRHVNFNQAWLREANFTGAYLEGVNFGQLANITLDTLIINQALSPNGRWLALVNESSEITIYDLEEEKIYYQWRLPTSLMIRTSIWAKNLDSHQNYYSGVTNCRLATTVIAFGTDNNTLYAVTGDYQVHSIQLTEKNTVFHFRIPGEEWELSHYHRNYSTQSRDPDDYNFLFKDPAQDTLIFREWAHEHYSHSNLSGELLSKVFENERILAISPPGTYLLTYSECYQEQRLYSLEKGAACAELITCHRDLYKPYQGHGQFYSAISHDHSHWAVLGTKEVGKSSYTYHIQIVNVDSGKVKTLPRLTKISSFSLSFGNSPQELIVVNKNTLTHWDWTTGKILLSRNLPLPQNNYATRYNIIVNPAYKQLMLFQTIPFAKQVLRYNLISTQQSLTFESQSKTQSYLTTTETVYPDISLHHAPLKYYFISWGNYFDLTVGEHKLTLNPSNNVPSRIFLKNRYALSKEYFALAQGYWHMSRKHIISHLQPTATNIITRSIGLVESTLTGESVFQDVSIYLSTLNGQASTHLTCHKAVIALAFSPDGRFLTAVDAFFQLQLWYLPQPIENSSKLKIKQIGSSISLPIAIDDYLKFSGPNLAVHNQGLVVISYNTTLLLLNKKSNTLSTFSVEMQISWLKFLDNILVCGTKKDERIVFNMIEVEAPASKDNNVKEYNLTLIYSSKRLSLHLEAAQFAQSLGLSATQRSLLQQQDAQGSPVDFTSEETKITCEEQFMLNDFTARLKDPTPMINDQFYSQLHHKNVLINYNHWVVALVRDEEAIDSRHTFLLIEGLNSFSKAVYIRIELVTRIYTTELDNGRLIQKNICVEDGFAKIRLSPMPTDGCSLVSDDLSEAALAKQLKQILRRPKETLRGQAWITSREKLVALYDYIQHQIKLQASDNKQFLTPYSLAGKMGFFSREKHNCYTWARELLFRLQDPKITANLPEGWAEYLIANPSTQLNTQLHQPQQNHTDSTVCTTSQPASISNRHCIMM